MEEKTILLVDDEPGIVKVMGISLRDRGYRVFTAQSGEEALTLFRELKPQIVLTDIKMPGVDGIQLLRRIKEEGPDTEVIMITGHGDMDLAVQSLKYEASDFITKPIQDESLEVALKRAHEKIHYRARLLEHTEDLERLVREKTEQLIASERLAAVGQTVATLAHAVKNIAAGLTGGMYVLEKGIELDNRQYLSQGWEMVKGNVHKIKNMAMDLLNFAKEREPDYALCDPNRPARDVVELMRGHALERGVLLRAELEETLPVVALDPEGIHRALLNLVTNAVDACTDVSCVTGKGEVLVRTIRPLNWAVEYQVIDNGCGMDDETKAGVFQVFFSTKGSMGTGLGLMIAKKIIDEHRGFIGLVTEKGKGTSVTIRLPEKEPPSR